MEQTKMQKEWTRLSKIWNNLQKEQAKTCISRQERAKTKLSFRERLLKFVQMGYGIRYKDVHFHIDEDDCWGTLTKADGSRVHLAALDDFYKEVWDSYGVVLA